MPFNLFLTSHPLQIPKPPDGQTNAMYSTKEDQPMAQSNESVIRENGECIMLALSTFRQSYAAINAAVESCRRGKRLVLVYVVDANHTHYLSGSNPELLVHGKELQRRYMERSLEHMKKITQRARLEGIEIETHVQTGRFEEICLHIARNESPSTIYTTRAERPAWMTTLFGSPEDHLIEHVKCPVVVL
jgi:nucleotide-binding universal stress UspA family protein